MRGRGRFVHDESVPLRAQRRSGRAVNLHAPLGARARADPSRDHATPPSQRGSAVAGLRVDQEKPCDAAWPAGVDENEIA